MIVPLELRNVFSDSSDDKNKNNIIEDDENDNVNSDNLNLRHNLNNLLDRTDLSEKRKSKRISAINADIIRRLNAENLK